MNDSPIEGVLEENIVYTAEELEIANAKRIAENQKKAEEAACIG